MHKEYRIKFIKSVYFHVVLAIFICQLFVAHAVLTSDSEWWYIPFFLVVTITLQAFFYYYAARLEVIIEEEKIFIKKLDKITKIDLKDIYKIEKVLCWGSFRFDLYYKEDGKRHTASFNNQIQKCQEILNYIEQETGIKVKWGL